MSTDLWFYNLNGQSIPILSYVDNFSRYVCAVILRGQQSNHVCDGLMSMFVKLSVPWVITTDNGSNYVSEQTTAMFDLLNIEHKRISPGNSRSNSIAETANKLLRVKVRTLLDENPVSNVSDLSVVVSHAALLLNSEVNDKIKTSPYMVVFGFSPSFVYGTELSLARKEQTKLNSKKLFENLKAIRQKCELELGKRALSKKSTRTKFQVGQTVRVRQTQRLKSQPVWSNEKYRIRTIKMNTALLERIIDYDHDQLIRGSLRKVHCRFLRLVKSDPVDNDDVMLDIDNEPTE